MSFWGRPGHAPVTTNPKSQGLKTTKIYFLIMLCVLAGWQRDFVHSSYSDIQAAWEPVRLEAEKGEPWKISH